MCAVRIPVLSSARTAGSNSQGTACETRDKDVECAQGKGHVSKYGLHTKGKVAKSLGNQARGVQPACTVTTQN